MAALITVKDAVSQAAMEIGISQRPVTTAVGSLDEDINQMVAQLRAVATEVMMTSPYEEQLADGYWLQADDGTPRAVPTADDDLILFDRRLAIAGLKFRFLKAKGLEFGEEMRDFTAVLNRIASRSNARVLDLNLDEGRVQ